MHPNRRLPFEVGGWREGRSWRRAGCGRLSDTAGRPPGGSGRCAAASHSRSLKARAGFGLTLGDQLGQSLDVAGRRFSTGTTRPAGVLLHLGPPRARGQTCGHAPLAASDSSNLFRRARTVGMGYLESLTVRSDILPAWQSFPGTGNRSRALFALLDFRPLLDHRLRPMEHDDMHRLSPLARNPAFSASAPVDRRYPPRPMARVNTARLSVAPMGLPVVRRWPLQPSR